MFESSESSPERVVARDARGFDEAGLDVDGFAAECPFPDVELPEVLDDDPWFADLDAARDAGADVEGDGGAAVKACRCRRRCRWFAPECPFEDDGEPGAPVGVRSVGDELSDLLARRPDAYVVVRLAGIDAGSLSPEDAIV